MAERDDGMTGILGYYSRSFAEAERLSDAWGQIELVRTQRIIRRHLMRPPAVVLDVGGAAGRYSCWLAQQGYEVHLVDPVPLHVDQARAASAAQAETPLASCVVGDARKLERSGGSADAVLLMGPLYHLIDPPDRHRALAEAHRVLRRGGRLFAAAISRFASSVDGLASGYFFDPAFRGVMLRDLEDGQHRNPTENPAFFTTAYFHHPDELAGEVRRAGFQLQALLAVEGISYLVQDLDGLMKNDEHREFVLGLIERVEQEPSLIGASPHLMCVAAKP